MDRWWECPEPRVCQHLICCISMAVVGAAIRAGADREARRSVVARENSGVYDGDDVPPDHDLDILAGADGESMGSEPPPTWGCVRSLRLQD